MPEQPNMMSQLDAFESEAVLDILHAEVLSHTTEARVEHACGKMSADELQWREGHAKFLIKAIQKLFPEYDPTQLKHAGTGKAVIFEDID